MNRFSKNPFPFLLILISLVMGVLLTLEPNLISVSHAVDTTHEAQPSRPFPLASEQAFVDVAKRVTPAVVNISTTRVVRRGREERPFFNDPYFRQFFGDSFSAPQVPREQKVQSLGSGVIVDPNGYIITNNHVVDHAEEVRVLLGDKREFKGKVIGTDPKTDLAVVKIDAKNLPTVPWADSAQLQVGEYVLAVGNPFGLNQTVTMGIVSAVGRANVGIADYEDFIQTDAAINPGNSGGALVNTRGELIGINTAIFSQSGGYMGIGFAVPSEMAKPVMESLIKTGKVVRGWLGVSIQEMTPKLAEQFGLKESKGVLVSDVLPKSPAEQAGIKRGDILLEIDGKPIEGAAQLRNIVTEAPVGKTLRIKRFSDGKESEVAVTIGEQPKEIARRGETEKAPPTALSGMQVQNLTPEIAAALGLPKDEQGVVIDRVEPGSLADEAGLQRGDVIVEINRQPIKDANDYNRAVSGLKRDEAALLLVNRRGATLFVTLSAS